jgi:nucleoside-diphosphate-sugar epimerase
MTSKVLITGATGFVGRHCLPILKSSGYEVHAISSKPFRDSPAGVHWHQQDLLHNDSIAGLIGEIKPTHLLHLAWCTEPNQYWNSSENLDWLQASLRLLHAFGENGGERVVMSGTCAEYDWSEGRCSEASTKLIPTSLYGTCKHALRLVVEAYAAQTGLSAAWGRLFFLYGPYEHPQRLVASVIRSLLHNEPALCTSGLQQRDFLFIEDAASALVALLNSNVRGPVNIASGQAVPIKDLATRIGDLLHRPELIRLGAIANDAAAPPLLVGDVERLKTEVKWQPQFDLQRGLAATIEWTRRQLSKQ